ncbi:hypothetical protein LCM02_05145 [Lutimonas saemankumensis]|uniref:hypothetical protein n=1 Tax=Lutimonas saemankumensis TaxID=483016 RepID=UPI001CD4260C|nr:hypothetical protein [Lutimonas saemankumensis]MCA0931828.1 hypothetical protein [Lutimonas saemankumensis]
MNRYSKIWKNRVDGAISSEWSPFPGPMSMKIKEDKPSKIFISASVGFKGKPSSGYQENANSSLYYRILVNGEKVVEYHVPNPRKLEKLSDVSIQGVSEIPPGENTVEVYYKGSKSCSWNYRQNQAEAELSVLAVPVH